MAKLAKCRDCGAMISRRAKACPQCGSGRPSAGIAGLLSLFLPGAGQIYKGNLFNGLLWFVLVVIGYVPFIIPGLILHLLCIMGAMSGSKVAK